MAYIDSFLTLSDAQALTASADATNVVDLQTSGIAAGIGNPMCVAFSVDVAADTADGNETYTFNIATGAATTLGTTVVSKTVAGATLAAGYSFVIPFDHTELSRYVGVEYALGGTSPSVTVSADIRPLNMVDATVDYANAYSIS